jgi:hypothetical protein
MAYLTFPRPLKALWFLFVVSIIGWYLQTTNPERFNLPLIVNLGQRLTVGFGVIAFVGTVWFLAVSWEQQIRKKGKRPRVDVSLIERHYGGTVFERRLPRRVWDAAHEGDRLVKERWSFVVRLQTRQRPPA